MFLVEAVLAVAFVLGAGTAGALGTACAMYAFELVAEGLANKTHPQLLMQVQSPAMSLMLIG